MKFESDSCSKAWQTYLQLEPSDISEPASQSAKIKHWTWNLFKHSRHLGRAGEFSSFQ